VPSDAPKKRSNGEPLGSLASVGADEERRSRQSERGAPQSEAVGESASSLFRAATDNPEAHPNPPKPIRLSPRARHVLPALQHPCAGSPSRLPTEASLPLSIATAPLRSTQFHPR